MSDITFRRAGSEDVATVAAITNAAYAKWVPIIGRKPKPMLADHAAAIRDHEVELALLDGKPVGLIELIPAPDHLLLESIAIDPASQGNGLGRVLMARVEDHAHRRGLPRVRLYTNKAFAANVDFYLRLGYAIDREEPFMGGLTVYFSKPIF
ncbi:MAG TPA: GNAT family N-acetyltransferase [Dongiaceae bacterium]|nr:GNAT family N-acetyltransferase [Dongiaceae bacterium]